MKSKRTAFILAVACLLSSCTDDGSITESTSSVRTGAPQSDESDELPEPDEPVCLEEPAPVQLLGGFRVPPAGLAVASAAGEDGLSEASWSLPEPEGGIVQGDPATEAYIANYRQITVWATRQADRLASIGAPWWAVDAGFPIAETIDTEIGTIEFVTLSEDVEELAEFRPVEPWYLARWTEDGTTFQVFTRGYAKSETLMLLAGVEAGPIELVAGGLGTLSLQREDAIAATFGTTFLDAENSIKEAWPCELRLVTAEGRAVSRSRAETMVVIGFEIESTTHLRLLLAEGPEELDT